MKIVSATAAFIAGLVGGYAASLAAYAFYIEVSGTFDREGALAMGVAFLIGPVVALVCGTGAAIWTIRRFGARPSAG